MATKSKNFFRKNLKPLVFFSAATVFLIASFYLSDFFPVKYSGGNSAGPVPEPAPKAPEKPLVTHLKTPTAVKSVYMTACAASSQSFRQRFLKIFDETEINAVVINIKDETGGITFKPETEILKAAYSRKCPVADLREFINTLHERGIYVIGRIAVFQDPLLVKARPDLAVKKLSDKTTVWKDKKGISWLDVGEKDVWDYIVSIGKESYEKYGFDELNFDYVRFPSDGNMSDIWYPASEGEVKSVVLKKFFQYLSENLRDTGVVLSADLFGMTTTNKDDLNIGQVLENALPYFDFVDPMVYPSHYPPTFLGYKNPATKPYEVVKFSMDKAVERVKIFDATVASTSPLKLRPWLQDFDLGATYTPEMVRAQMKATYDSGLDSWMLWDPTNYYTLEALENKNATTSVENR